MILETSPRPPDPPQQRESRKLLVGTGEEVERLQPEPGGQGASAAATAAVG